MAAAAVFATADPFNAIQFDPFAQQPYTGDTSCKLSSYPKSVAPILLVHRSCDFAVPCDADQHACFGGEPGFATLPWLSEAALAGITGIEPLLLGGIEGPGQDLEKAGCSSVPQASCVSDPCSGGTDEPACLCLLNHLRWPDGTYNSFSSGIDVELQMLDFLRAHPLP